MADFVVDAFTESSSVLLENHTPDTGGSWTKHSSFTGPFAVDAGDYFRMSSTKVNSGLYYAGGTPAGAEYQIDIDYITTGTLSTLLAVGAAGRINTGANTCYFQRYEGSVGDWQMYKTVSGSSTILGSYTQSLSTNTTYFTRFKLLDSAKSLEIDSVERITNSDNAITAAGKAGIREGTGSSSSLVHLDDYLASDIGVSNFPLATLQNLGRGFGQLPAARLGGVLH